MLFTKAVAAEKAAAEPPPLAIAVEAAWAEALLVYTSDGPQVQVQ